jgi:DNA repair protein RadC
MDSASALENLIVQHSLAILASRLRETSVSLSNPGAVEEYLLHKLMLQEREVFGALWLDGKHRVVAYEELMLGTLCTTQIYPREVVKSALKHNAAAGIFFHCHPGGDTRPSDSDQRVTADLKKALALVEVRVLDHVIIAGTQTLSFFRHGLLGELQVIRDKRTSLCD